jgi:ADP-heptose:LPS heptosyltransferase
MIPLETVKKATLSMSEINAFGLTVENFKKFDTLEELKKYPPSIVISECVQNISFIQNHYKQQTLKKKEKYVTSLGIYQQLLIHPFNKNKVLRPAQIQFKNLYKPYFGEDLTNKTILVWRTGGLGDLLFIQPNLLYIKEKYPTCKIKFSCGPQYRSMVETWDCVDEILDLPFVMSELIRSDYHILFEGVIERCREAETINSYILFSKWIGLNLPKELLIPKQKAKIELVNECKEILDQFKIKGKFIVVQLRASSPIRTPSFEVWKKIINYLTNLDYQIIITDSPEQSRNIDNFINELQNKDKVFNFAKYSKNIGYTIALVSLAYMTISTDSSMIHIANSLGIKNIGIYGPFSGKVRLETYDQNLCKWIDCKDHCAPCFIHGHTPCKYAGKDGFSPCYNNLDMNEFIEKFESLNLSIKGESL